MKYGFMGESRAAGVVFALDGDKLRVTNAAPAAMDYARRHKDEIIGVLRAETV